MTSTFDLPESHGWRLQPIKALPRCILRKSVRATRISDEAGIDIKRTVLSQSPRHPTPYDLVPPHLLRRRNGLGFAPPLSYFCVLALQKRLVHVDEHLPELTYTRYKDDRSMPDPIKSLIPHYDPRDGSVHLERVHPMLWLTLAQIYTSSLPPFFHVLHLPLGDQHVPIFQTIEPTERFAMVTVIDFAHCVELDDRNVIDLKDLHQLAHLDASFTRLTSNGIRAFSRTLRVRDDIEGRQSLVGPWKLRSLRLRGCGPIDNSACQWLDKWPLLCVVDLRDTGCQNAKISSWLDSVRPAYDPDLLAPSSGRKTLRHLHATNADLFPNLTQFPYVLSISKLDHPEPPPSAQQPSYARAEPGICAIIPGSSHQQREVVTFRDLSEAEKTFFEKQEAKEEWERRRVERECEHSDYYSPDGEQYSWDGEEDYCGTDFASDDEINFMDEVAEDVLQEAAQARSTAAFYAPVPRASQPEEDNMEQRQQEKADWSKRAMRSVFLIRTPPPYSTLTRLEEQSRKAEMEWDQRELHGIGDSPVATRKRGPPPEGPHGSNGSKNRKIDDPLLNMLRARSEKGKYAAASDSPTPSAISASAPSKPLRRAPIVDSTHFGTPSHGSSVKSDVTPNPTSVQRAIPTTKTMKKSPIPSSNRPRSALDRNSLQRHWGA